MELEEITEHFDEQALVEFWEFVNERHEIYIRRFIDKQPAPWTNDPILRTVFFTNVYRELDIGTQYLFEHVLNRGSVVEECFEILLYRQFNNRRTYDFLRDVGRKYGNWSNWKGIATLLKSYAAEKNIVFTDAHMTTGIKWGGFENKIDNVCWLMHEHWKSRKNIHEALMVCSSLEELCEMIASLKGYGDFLAYEVATDFGYSKRLKRFTEDDWANPGPGCRKAIDVLLPTRKELRIQYLDVIKLLRLSQRAYFDCLRINFRFLKDSGEEKELTLRNIEHSLCEFYKYHRAKHTGQARRKYTKGESHG